MKERPILFSAPMVRAILEGRKTQTRRILKNPEYYGCPTGDCPHSYQAECNAAMSTITDECPYGQVGDQLWVREAFEGIGRNKITDAPLCIYRADHEEQKFKWRPSIHMPRRASRIDLKIIGIRVEQLQNISEADASAEGCFTPEAAYAQNGPRAGALNYKWLWESINGDGSWDSNPWVWVVEFERLRP